MAQFYFRLQPVLEMREREERDKKLVLSQLEQQRVAIEDRIRGYQRNIEHEQGSLAQMLDGSSTIDFRGARLQANAALSNRFSAQRLVIELAGLFEQIEHARKELMTAAAARKAVELLKDRQREEFESEQRRRETIELDDMTVMRHARQTDVLL
jgi:flagellar export protein FliJ